MGYYGVVFGSFWDGPTGRAIKRRGGGDAQLIGSYLMTAPGANMLGLFFLPLDAIHDHVAITRLRLARAFDVLEAEDFAHYDTVTQFVWVVEMARFRCAIKPGQTELDVKDHRVVGVNRLYKKLPNNPFLEPLYQKYRRMLRLQGRRKGKGLASPLPVASKGEGKPLVSQVPGTRYQIPGTRKNNQVPGKAARLTARDVPGQAQDNFRVISRLVRTVFDEDPAWIDASDLTSEIKTRCAQLQIAYEATTVGRAIDSEVAKARHRRAG